jgi:hypothetical protein
MAQFDRFMVAPINSGVQSNVKPWLVPDDAFAQLNNAYTWRSRIRKRFGSRYLYPTSGVTAGYEQLASRLRINIGKTGGALTVPGALPITKVGGAVSVGDRIFTITTLGVPAPMLSTDPLVTGTINTTTGAIAFVGIGAGLDVYYYPSDPVMGFVNYQNGAINNQPTYAFDPQFAYQYGATGWERLGTYRWKGTDADFFWGTTWRGATNNANILFVTNFNNSTTPDNIQYWNGAAWTALVPSYLSTAAGDTIATARIILPFKDRLILLNTWEVPIGGGAAVQFFNRCRFSQNGSPLAADAWYQDISGKGGYIDCPVKEQILTAQFLRDHLIVYFERSTWELVYTGNQILPFVWQQLNTKLGAMSTFSEVPFDQQVFGIGSTGIHECTGGNVNRIDMLIPDEVFAISNENSGPYRVCGIRDYYAEMVYWSYPYGPYQVAGITDVYPNQVFVYNYKTQSWAFNDDTITALGYYNQQASLTWGLAQQQSQEMSSTWNSSTLLLRFDQIIAGNQEGYTFIVDTETNNNASALQITNIAYTVATTCATFTVINHNLNVGDYVGITNTQGVTPVPADVFIGEVTNPTVNTFDVITPYFATGTYTGGGVIQRVTPIDIYTKQYNFYADQDKNAFVSKVDFLVDRTTYGELTVDFMTSSSTESLVDQGTISGSIMGTNVLETSPYTSIPYEATQDRLWHPIYLQATGEVVQMRFYLTPDQTMNTPAALSEFEMHAFTIYAQPVGRLQ